jgi:glycosyltransferase involved in cell wall biosynthesis
LPHFHGDDRFYYWRRYFEAFEQADANLLFSTSIARKLDQERHSFAVVPGGGVRPDEPSDLSARNAFHEVYASQEPFFLVLGRKTASKGYQRILRTHQALRKSGVDVGLVLIGPDEDGQAISGEHVCYLGRQPRSVIRGALSCSLGLVTMSGSESFGIVLCEAWLFGKPVIANNACYSFRELVRDRETGILVNSDVELLAGMKYLVENRAAAERMGGNGFREVLNLYSWDTVAQSCLQQLLPAQAASVPAQRQASR